MTPQGASDYFHYRGVQTKASFCIRTPINEKQPFSGWFSLRAENGIRTRGPQLGKLMLYQLSYFRKKFHFLHLLAAPQHRNEFLCVRLAQQFRSGKSAFVGGASA